MNVLVTHCDSTMADCAVLFLKSLAKCSDCIAYVYGYGLSDEQVRRMGDAFPNVVHILLDADEFVGRIATSKVECVGEAVDGEDADCLYIASDVDMLVKYDPFRLFENDGDVFVTRRPSEWKHPINGGLWGFRKTDAGYRFIDFYVEQVHRKDWPPYRNYLKKFGHFDEVNWRVGQDFLNVIATTPLPFPCKVTILGPEWNWIHDSGPKTNVGVERQGEQSRLFEKAKRAYRVAFADPAIHVLHFKARMKNEMPAFAKEMGII